VLIPTEKQLNISWIE